MPATRYKIWHFGGPVGEGAMGSVHVGVAAVAKRSTPDFPYLVANELICSQLARAILLPIPPGFVIEHEGTPYFVSLNFNLAGEQLPPIDAQLVATAHPELSAGIILFDSWIANGDRHGKNIAYHQATKRTQIFDHSHAFYASATPRVRLENLGDEIGIGGHCLAPELTSLAGIKQWHDRIKSIPEYFVKEVITSTVELGFPSTEVQFAADFLLARRNNLLTLVKANSGLFRKVQQELWTEL